MGGSSEYTAVLGCGIIGLTTAIRLVESGKHPRVHILADHLPLDELDPQYASSAAGAHHLSFASDKDLRQRYLDARTFEVFWKEIEHETTKGGEQTGLMKIKQTEFYDGEERHLEFLSGLPDVCFMVESRQHKSRLTAISCLASS